MSAKVHHTPSTIQRLEDIPVFRNEAEEHAFWAAHELSDRLWEQAEPFAPDELPPPLLKEFVTERLYERRSVKDSWPVQGRLLASFERPAVDRDPAEPDQHHTAAETRSSS